MIARDWRAVNKKINEIKHLLRFSVGEFISRRLPSILVFG